MSQGPVLLNSE